MICIRRLLLPLLATMMVAATALPVRAQNALCRAAITAAEAEYSIPDRLLLGIGRVESGRRDPETGAFDPWPWTINAEGRGSFFPTRQAAIAAVRELQAGGMRSIDVGCMQINLRHHPEAFANLEEAFDPLANARYSARFLTNLRNRAGDWTTASGHYHSQTPDLATAYRQRLANVLARERQAPSAEPPATLLAAASSAAAQPGPGAVAQAPVAFTPFNGRGLDAYRGAPIVIAGRGPAPMAASTATRPMPASAQAQVTGQAPASGQAMAARGTPVPPPPPAAPAYFSLAWRGQTAGAGPSSPLAATGSLFTTPRTGSQVADAAPASIGNRRLF